MHQRERERDRPIGNELFLRELPASRFVPEGALNAPRRVLIAIARTIYTYIYTQMMRRMREALFLYAPSERQFFLLFRGKTVRCAACFQTLSFDTACRVSTILGTEKRLFNARSLVFSEARERGVFSNAILIIYKFTDCGVFWIRYMYI